MKTILFSRLSKCFAISALLIMWGSASAHVVVSPNAAATSQYQNFSLGVPNEKDTPTTAVRLLIPEGLDRVTPFVKPGWHIEVIKNATGTTTEIRWSGGSIPVGEKDVFEFTGRTPTSPTTLMWRAYQTYQGGIVVAWDQDPKSGSTVNANPYSVTEVTQNGTTVSSRSGVGTSTDQVLSIVAIALSVLALLLSVRKNRTNV